MYKVNIIGYNMVIKVSECYKYVHHFSAYRTLSWTGLFFAPYDVGKSGDGF